MNGLAPVRQPGSESGRVIYIDQKGNRVLGNYFEGRNFSEGFAAVSTSPQKWIFVDTSGKVLQNSESDEGNWFSEGLAPGGVEGKRGYIDTHGNFVIPPQFEEADSFQDGLACVGVGKHPNKRFGFIDKTGKFVINPVLQSCGGYSNLGGFSDGFALVLLSYSDGQARQRYIDREGNSRLEPPGKRGCQFVDGLAGVIDDGKLGYINTSGVIVWPLTK